MEAKTIVCLLPHIVENIMKYLPIRDLRTCQKICLLWNDLATQEICRRQYFVPFSHGPYCEVHYTFHLTDTECRYNSPRKLSEDALNEYMKEMCVVSAQMCITFITLDFAAWYQTHPNIHSEDGRDEPVAQQNAKLSIRYTLMRHLSRETIPQLFLADGIVFWSNDGIPLKSEGLCGMSGVMIPDDPEIKIYSCGPEDIYVSKQDNLDKCSLLKRIPKDVDIKCLLLFTESTDFSCKYRNFVEACQDRQSTRIAVGGLRVVSLFEDTDSEMSFSYEMSDSFEMSDSYEMSDLDTDTDSDADIESDLRMENAEDISSVQSSRIIDIVPHSDTDSEIDSDIKSDASMERDSGVHGCQVIAFCGKRVEAASVTTYSSDSQETIERNLCKFQEIGLRKKKCLAFMFRDSCHLIDYNEVCNYESSIFHRLYPDVPLIGAMGMGIIGTNTVPNVSGKSLEIPNNSVEKSYAIYGHKCVFVFIAISILVECADFTD